MLRALLTGFSNLSDRGIIRSSPDWDAAHGPDWAHRIMDVGVTDRKHVKQGRSIVRWVVSPSLTVYLKRHFGLPCMSGWLARFFPRRAWSPGLQEWVHLEWCRRAGLPVPRAVAAGEFRGPGGRLRSFLAVEELTGMLALHEAIPRAKERLSAAEFARWKRGLVLELARVCREMHRRRAFHRDLYLCHFFIPETDTTRIPADWAVTMLDLHRFGCFPFTWPIRQGKDLAQLLFSTFDVPGVTSRDWVRFWRRYRDGNWAGVTRPPAILRRFVRFKAMNYSRHNSKHDLAVPRKD